MEPFDTFTGLLIQLDEVKVITNNFYNAALACRCLVQCFVFVTKVLYTQCPPPVVQFLHICIYMCVYEKCSFSMESN